MGVVLVFRMVPQTMLLDELRLRFKRTTAPCFDGPQRRLLAAFAVIGATFLAHADIDVLDGVGTCRKITEFSRGRRKKKRDSPWIRPTHEF